MGLLAMVEHISDPVVKMCIKVIMHIMFLQILMSAVIQVTCASISVSMNLESSPVNARKDTSYLAPDFAKVRTRVSINQHPFLYLANASVINMSSYFSQT